MRNRFPSLFFLLVFFACSSPNEKVKPLYLSNQAPLIQEAYLELPIGSIKPEDWLEDQLLRMANGMTGHLDEIYPEVVGERNGWLGGDGDGWERGPYWIDGLLPLAYILDDEKLKEKALKWVNWTLDNQAESGYIGPIPFETDPESEAGIQKGPRKDWWPKMVMLKVLQQYYQATQDERVISALTKYFHFQLEELPSMPMDHLSFWANRRAGDNLQVVYWLYNITGDPKLIELGEIIQEQTFPWQTIYNNPENDRVFENIWHYNQVKGYPFDSEEIQNLTLTQIPGLHTVNIAQGLKQPGIYYQKSGDPSAIESIKTALATLKKHHGQAQGMYGGDEPLHGNAPTQGIEFCSISEEMFSLESLIKISGDMEFADLLEKIVYNALPTQASDDYSSRQYFQAANQVSLSDSMDTSYETEHHGGTDFVFGTLSGYPCCTTNMHQSWPKFVQNLFYATHDRGVAAFQYAPSSATLKVGENVELTLKETTGYPFRDQVSFEMGLSESSEFPFHLRIPAWAISPTITINGEMVDFEVKNGITILNQTWNNGDQITLALPSKAEISTWYKGMAAIEKGPLVYSLKIESKSSTKDRMDRFRPFIEHEAISPWNFALSQSELININNSIEIIENKWDGSYPWNLENAPLEIKVRGIQVSEWRTVNGAPLLPDNLRKNIPMSEWENQNQLLTLIPYGCSTLRITEFPVVEVLE
ncbi:beta-L-arabinofuranosidase domain-containing protein [Algoriphagus zhangzhouensis]|uniref:Beta-L-arabinofuranosidase, GH127 n=1 Tax=Algoriphagus zhangzhouensis TaxID=1073327 RepID=A0A1M7ZFT0_9BACT|nr:beta-L-arabinofuranosidase domain-containing protein [Algoriphagus zhangzhouensis]TDY45007.1 beta-L-arabinofuranosidase (glycosyl hydrolase family 127) [Algoriphagus zhangzhouensis]SHO63702.1 Beta-L-arabinofuranosidase, GH127 [Algoriphagus zhangzhouensis]